MMQPLMKRRLGILALIAGFLTPIASGQVVYPEPPKEYDVQLRFKLRAPLPGWYDRFDEMLAAMTKVGFARVGGPPAGDLEDPSTDTLRGSIASDRARALLRVAGVETLLLAPKGFALPKADQRVKVRIEMAAGLSAPMQLLLKRQALPRLEALGFREGIGYEHRGFTWLLGTMPAGRLTVLLADLRGLPSGWLLPRDPIPSLDPPLRTQPPVAVIEVLPEPPDVPPMQDPPAPPIFAEAKAHFAKLAPDLRDLVEKEMDDSKYVRVEAVLAYSAPAEDREWEQPLRAAATSVQVEGRLGHIATIKVKTVHAAEIARLSNVLHVRLPRSGEPIRRTAPGSSINALAETGLDKLHAAGHRGQGVAVAVLGGDFGGWEKAVGTRLPKGTRLVDFTAARNPNMLPDPMPSSDGALGSGTISAMAVHKAAPDAQLILVRVDPASPHQIILFARMLHEAGVTPRSLEDRYNELSRDRQFLELRRLEVLAQRRKAYDEQIFDEGDAKVPEQRKKFLDSQERIKKAEAALKELEQQEKEHQVRSQNYLLRRNELAILRNVRVVICPLSWNDGHPLNGDGELAKYFDEKPFVGYPGDPTKSRLVSMRQNRGTLWVQSAGDARGQTWVGQFRDEDGNGAMEFVPSHVKIPQGRWSPELNFLAWQTHAGQASPDLPEKVRLRVTLQWREPHDPALFAAREDPYRTPLSSLSMVAMKQRDPSGKKLATDDLEVLARSYGTPVRVLHAPHASTYETTAEFDAVAGGRVALRVEGTVPSSIRPGDVYNGSQLPLEIRPRISIEVLDADSRGKGRVVFQDFLGGATWPNGGLGSLPEPWQHLGGVSMPADARSVISVGAAGPDGKPRFYSSIGAGPARDLLVKPDVLGYDGFDLGPGIPTGGSAMAASFHGGLAACLVGWSAPAQPRAFLQMLQQKPGTILRIPETWQK